MYIVIGILAGIIILQFIIMWKYQRQVKDICRQLTFLMKHDSNMLINREFDMGGIGILSDRLNEMLEELFTFTKLKNESYNLELTSCCINRILKETVFSYYDDWLRKGIQPDIQITEEPIYIQGNQQGASSRDSECDQKWGGSWRKEDSYCIGA